MYKIKIFSVGKTKESWLQQAVAEYEERLATRLRVEWIFVKTDAQLSRILDKEERYICLTPEGKSYSSEGFSAALLSWLERGDSRMGFVIGGAEGIAPEVKKRAAGLLSLSPMTLTHQMTRLLLMEQLYRSLEIDRGSGYHK